MTARPQPEAPPPTSRPPTRRRRFPRPVLVTFLLLPLLAGCASTPLGSGARDAEIQQQLREIKQRLVEVQREGAVTRVQVEEMERRIATLEQRAGIRPPGSAPDTGGATSTGPRGNSPTRSHAEATRPRRDDPVREDRRPQPIESPSAGVEGRDIVIEPPVRTPPAGQPADAPAADATPISTAAQAIYDRGYTLYHQGRYLDAEASFQRFLQAHADTDLADNAQYWIGEARYARGDVPGSLAAFREVVARYPQGNKVPDALLKAGQSLERLGDRESARRSYQELLDSFPNSAAALVAEERLQALP